MVVVRLPAEPASLPELRRRVERWLRALDWPDDDREDVVLAVNEACANAIDHAYPPGEPGPVELTGRVLVDGTARRAVVQVRDHGRWRPAPADPGFRGHGLAVMRACLERVEIRSVGRGTTVVMTGCPVPRERAPARRRAPLRRGTGPSVRVAVDLGTAERRHRRHLLGRRVARVRAEAAMGVARARVVRARAGSVIRTSARLVEQSLRLYAARRGTAAPG